MVKLKPLSEQTIVLTGASSGIGLVTARMAAKRSTCSASWSPREAHILSIIAIIPDVLLFELQVPPRIAYFFGGTGMLITVGVILDTMRQIETFLLQRHYDGFLKKGRIRGRSTSANVALGDGAWET